MNIDYQKRIRKAFQMFDIYLPVHEFGVEELAQTIELLVSKLKYAAQAIQLRDDRKIRIPDINSEETLVAIINDLKHYLKTREFHKYPMLEDFNDVLNRFIVKWKLDGDQHSYASLPGER